MIVTNIIGDRILCTGPSPFSYRNWKIKMIYLRKNSRIRLLTGLKNHGGPYFSWSDLPGINMKLLLMLLSSPGLILQYVVGTTTGSVAVVD